MTPHPQGIVPCPRAIAGVVPCPPPTPTWVTMKTMGIRVYCGVREKAGALLHLLVPQLEVVDAAHVSQRVVVRSLHVVLAWWGGEVHEHATWRGGTRCSLEDGKTSMAARLDRKQWIPSASLVSHTADCKAISRITQKWMIHRFYGRQYRRDIGVSSG